MGAAAMPSRRALRTAAKAAGSRSRKTAPDSSRGRPEVPSATDARRLPGTADRVVVVVVKGAPPTLRRTRRTDGAGARDDPAASPALGGDVRAPAWARCVRGDGPCRLRWCADSELAKPPSEKEGSAVPAADGATLGALSPSSDPAEAARPMTGLRTIALGPAEGPGGAPEAGDSGGSDASAAPGVPTLGAPLQR